MSSTASNACTATDSGAECRETPVTHTMVVQVPGQPPASRRVCEDCAKNARDHDLVVDVHPIVLDVDRPAAVANAIAVSRDRVHGDPTPAFRVDTANEQLVVERRRVDGTDWRPLTDLLTTIPEDVEGQDWRAAASLCVRDVVQDREGREWSLPSEDLARALRGDDGDVEVGP